MAVLHLALEEGFEDDDVVIAVDGEEALRAEAVRTRMQTGLARAGDVPVPDGRHTVTVQARGASASIDVDVAGELYLGVSLSRSGDAIEHRVSREPFGYV
jgi:hypothetical protein